MIQVHGYPKEYFFAVTNKGIGGLLRRWGEGASMLRGTWKARSPDAIEVDEDDEDKDEDKDENISNTSIDVQTEDTSASEADAHGEIDELSQSTVASRHDRRNAPHQVPRNSHGNTNGNSNGTSQTRLHMKQHRRTRSKASSASVSESVDALTTSLNSLSLLPSSVRFGRGSAHGGFMFARGYGRGGPRGGARGMHHGGTRRQETQIRDDKEADDATDIGDEDSRSMVPRVLTRKRGSGMSDNAARENRNRGRWTKAA